MKTIFKYAFPMQDNFIVNLPKDAQILSVQAQQNTPVFWAIIDTDNQNEVREFRLIGTGHSIKNADNLKHIGTFQLFNGSFVGHLFEVL